MEILIVIGLIIFIALANQERFENLEVEINAVRADVEKAKSIGSPVLPDNDSVYGSKY